MAEPSRHPSIARALLIAALITLLVTAFRLLCEQRGWLPGVFSTEPGGQGSTFGIAFLVPIFGFWFGRRLAQNGHRPTSTGKAIVLPLAGIAVMIATAVAVFQFSSDWLVRAFTLNGAAVATTCLAFAAWRRAWVVNVCYGYLARIPVLIAQFVSLERGWENHYTKAAPGSLPEHRDLLLTLPQLVIWPLGFTALVGGLFAALGAATVRRG